MQTPESVVVKLLEENRYTKADLARMMGKNPERFRESLKSGMKASVWLDAINTLGYSLVLKKSDEPSISVETEDKCRSCSYMALADKLLDIISDKPTDDINPETEID